MSREEVVFTKRAIVVVSVISVIASNVIIGFMAAMWLWRFSDQVRLETTAAATAAAISAVETTIRPIREDQIRHVASDDKTEGRISTELEAIKKRQDNLENRIDRIDKR